MATVAQVALCNGEDSLEKVEKAIFCSRPSLPVHLCHMQVHHHHDHHHHNHHTHDTPSLLVHLCHVQLQGEEVGPPGHVAAGRVHR